MEMEGYRQVWIPESFYNRLLHRLEEAKKLPGIALKPAGEWCLTIVIVNPDGTRETVCLGNCAWYKRIFGGDCVGQRGGACHCSWGILEPIFSRFRR